MVRAGLGYLASADPGQILAATQAECLRELEQDAAGLAAARAWILASFTAGQGYAADGDYSAVSWLMHGPGSPGVPRSVIPPGLSGSPRIRGCWRRWPPGRSRSPSGG